MFTVLRWMSFRKKAHRLDFAYSRWTIKTLAATTAVAQSRPAAAGAKAVAAATPELCYFAQSTTAIVTVNAQSTLSQRLSRRPQDATKTHTFVKSRRPWLDIRISNVIMNFVEASWPLSRFAVAECEFPKR